jgi:hypothetical protein
VERQIESQHKERNKNDAKQGKTGRNVKLHMLVTVWIGWCLAYVPTLPTLFQC